ncbi:MAG TPA: serine/threonine-protein kinase, partial [Gemmataceae bacterium]|nr:serine/threonine-protein kinase [Gemmataceae bacterium]
MDSIKTITTAHALIDSGAASAHALTPGRLLLQALIESGVILLEEWQAVDETVRHLLLDSPSRDELLPMLLEHKLLTDHQAARIRAGGMEQLIFGNYRILDRIGVGGMGIVYRGEHMLMRRPVAIKVLQTPADADETLLKRFFVEMRVLARMRHPNIVGALDAGHRKPSEHETHHLHYLVMEYVTGTNLEQLAARETLSVSRATDLIYQIASALDETHRARMIHRDIKPSNILVTAENTAKLLDFGLALHFGRRLTNPGTLLG